jgi:hypothetical protein
MSGKETGFRFVDLIVQHVTRICPGGDVLKLVIIFLGLLPVDLDEWIAEGVDLPDPEWTRPCSKVFLVRSCHVTSTQFDDSLQRSSGRIFRWRFGYVTSTQFDDSLQRLEDCCMAEVRRDPGDMVSVLLRYKDWPKLPDWKKEGGA